MRKLAPRRKRITASGLKICDFTNAWPEEKVRTLASMWNKNKSVAEIARKIEINEEAVRLKIVSIIIAVKSDAEKRPVNLERAAIRVCIRCQNDFFSEHTINIQMCGDCNMAIANMNDDEGYQVYVPRVRAAL